MKKKNFDQIATELPMLREIETLCRLFRQNQVSKANAVWYEVIKPVVVKSVGNMSSYPAFKSSEAYDVVYQHLSDVLDGTDR